MRLRIEAAILYSNMKLAVRDIWCDCLPCLYIAGRRFHCAVLGCLNIVCFDIIIQATPESCCRPLQSTKECWVSWLQPGLFLCKLCDFVSIELVECVPSRPLACELDVFTPGTAVVVVKPFLDFLWYRIKLQVPQTMWGKYRTALASTLSKGESLGWEWHSSPITLSMSNIQVAVSPSLNLSRYCPM